MRAFAAAAAGLLVGFFVGGLDSSSILASVMTAILGIVATVLGATKLGFLTEDKDDYNVRVAAFSVATLLALLGGIWFKLNNPLGPTAPTLASQYAAFRAIGFPEPEARGLAVYSIYKLAIKEQTASKEPAAKQ